MDNNQPPQGPNPTPPKNAWTKSFFVWMAVIFGLVLFVRHFKEAIPLQTTAMSEVATVLGGYDNVEQAILNIYNRTKPEIIGICSTGVTETIPCPG